MKALKPIHIILIGSSVMSVLLIILLLILNNAGELKFLHYFLAFIICFTCSFFILYFLIKRFIGDRLKILYRTIRKGKNVSANYGFEFGLRNDVISEAEKEAKIWTEDKNAEISKLKVQEEFRREFLGNLAHELKTPIFAIQGYILTLLDGGMDDETVNVKFLERASKATDRMVSIIEDLDQITRLEVDNLKLDMKDFDLIDLINDIFDTLEIKAKEKKIKLEFAKNYPATYVYADRVKIAQVLTNLISNSISYGKDKGQTLVRLFVLDGVVTVEVSDNGPGIDEKNLPRLFERFYRVEKSRNRNEGGSGLGLAIVKHIIESHQQSINVRSTVGIGSTFAFTLEEGKSIQTRRLSDRGGKI